MRYTALEMTLLQEAHDKRTFRYVLFFGAIAFTLTVVLAVTGAVLAVPYTGYLFGVCVFAIGVTLGTMLLLGFRNGSVIASVVHSVEDWLEKQKELQKPAEVPAAASTPAPADESTIKVTYAGGRAVELPRETVLGFEPSDLKYFCQYVCEGNSLAENRIQSIPLPSGELIGELKPGTPLTRFVNACVEAGILIDRDGKKKLTGTLTVTDPKEMYRRLKELKQS